MTGQSINDFLPPEMRNFTEQNIQHAKRAFDEWMAATRRVLSTSQGQALPAQTSGHER